MQIGSCPTKRRPPRWGTPKFVAMPDESKKKNSQSLAELIEASKRLRAESNRLNAKIAKLDEAIAEEAAALVIKVKEEEDREKAR